MTTSRDIPAIDLRNVAKVYGGRVQALQGISLHVRQGEVFGLLGPNGAGKSTLVKIMMTVVRPTRAEGTILGEPVGHKPTLARVGYLPENHRFPRYLTGRQVLDFFAALDNVDRRTRMRRSSELLATVGMSDWADRKVSEYSKGMLQRIGLAQALVHDPDLIVLDEPTDGVDPVGRRDILDVLGRLRGQGKTVFINSHALSELESICDRVAILVTGQVAREGSIDELTVAKQRYEIEVVVDDAATLRARILSALAPASGTLNQGDDGQQAPIPALPALPTSPLMTISIDRGTLSGGPWYEVEGPIIRIGTTHPEEVQGVLDALRRGGLMIRRIQSVRPSLEDLFLQAVIDPQTGLHRTPGAALATSTGGAR